MAWRRSWLGPFESIAQSQRRGALGWMRADNARLHQTKPCVHAISILQTHDKPSSRCSTTMAFPCDLDILPLHSQPHSVCSNNIRVIKLLLDHNADLNLDGGGYWSLHECINFVDNPFQPNVCRMKSMPASYIGSADSDGENL